jgi:hypothetical protein
MLISGRRLLIACGLLLLGSKIGSAQPTSITVSGNPGSLRISSAIAGSQPTPVSNAATTYTLVIGGSANRRYKITAGLNTAMPPGVTLMANLAAPPGGTSLGAVALDATARDVVINIPGQTNVTRGITYQLSALVTAGVVTSRTRTVTFTIIRTA